MVPEASAQACRSVVGSAPRWSTMMRSGVGGAELLRGVVGRSALYNPEREDAVARSSPRNLPLFTVTALNVAMLRPSPRRGQRRRSYRPVPSHRLSSFVS